MEYQGLRGWLDRVSEFGELKTFTGAHWHLEMGGICDIIHRESKVYPPAILFDEIQDYPSGFRALFGHFGSPSRIALTMGFPMNLNGLKDLVLAYREKIKDITPIPPEETKAAPFLTNLQEEAEVNLTKFPAPFHHELDGGRYLGTGHMVITRDPDSGWVNLGTYRLMLHDERTLGFYATPGKHGSLHRQKYHESGKPCPVAVVLGCDPALWLASITSVPYGVSEYDFVGGLHHKPVTIVRGPLTGLPLPEDAEIVLEGEIPAGELRDEGPFGEWTGYYASSKRPEPILKVKRVMYRDDPILSCGHPSRPPHAGTLLRAIARSAHLWEEMERAGVPDIRGIWAHEAGSRQWTVVSIKQRYPGHAKQAGVLAAQCRSGGYLGRFIVVVDEDIDPTNTFDVIWALSSRTDPEKDIDVLRRTWSSPVDPLIRKPTKAYFNSRAVIDACKPFEWINEFPPVCESSPELRRQLIEKFGREKIGI